LFLCQVRRMSRNCRAWMRTLKILKLSEQGSQSIRRRQYVNEHTDANFGRAKRGLTQVFTPLYATNARQLSSRHNGSRKSVTRTDGHTGRFPEMALASGLRRLCGGKRDSRWGNRAAVGVTGQQSCGMRDAARIGLKGGPEDAGQSGPVYMLPRDLGGDRRRELNGRIRRLRRLRHHSILPNTVWRVFSGSSRPTDAVDSLAQILAHGIARNLQMRRNLANRSTLPLVLHGSDLMYHSPPLQSGLPADLSETGA
jgi:hypothetical protein